MTGKTVTLEVYTGPSGASLAIFDGGCGHRLAGDKITLKTLQHRFEVDLDELIREAIAIRDEEE